MQIERARVLVAGGAHRVGAALALDLAQAGAHVAISYHSSAEEGLATAARIEALGVRSAAIFANAGDPASMRTLVDEAAEALDGLDAYVHCPSGGFEPRPPDQIDEQLWHAAIDSTAKGFLFGAQAAHQIMRGQGGVIVAINDVAAVQPWPAFAAHCAAKAAQAQLVKCLALAWGGDGVRVCAIAPGPVLMPDGGVRGVSEETVLGRQGDPQDVAQALRYLLEADFVTGTNLVVDGGRILRP
jgi:NAD(P)-dependent dehydrogenase (short-subunit alcohol dehydrogenase family)